MPAAFKDSLVCKNNIEAWSISCTWDANEVFNTAKNNALKSWITNHAGSRPTSPLQSLVKPFWHDSFSSGRKRMANKANARVILQGFKHVDVISRKLDTESPTLSKVGRQLTDTLDKDIRLLALLNRNTRKRLARLMHLKDDELLRTLTPAFGDVGAPKQRHATADRVGRDELSFLRHVLDRCVYISTRAAVTEDDPYEKDGHPTVVDGIIGLHVDDIIGGGEGVNGRGDVEFSGPEKVACFKDRAQRLPHRFKFDFDYKQIFCGAQVEQSFELDAVAPSLQKYVHSIKPITLEKSRNPGSKLLEMRWRKRKRPS